jgi:DegV family protein with EDD domain
MKHASGAVAESALLGARGNSGIILAQYLYGLSQEIGEEIRISTEQFGRAVKNAIHYAYEALSQPREGTILTVIKDWAENVFEHRTRFDDFHELLNHSLNAAKESLKRTKQKLQVLRESNVVDSGAQGFVYFIEGILNFIREGRVKNLKILEDPEILEVAHTELQLEDLKHRYCTECLIEGKAINIPTLKQAIDHLGDSVVLAGSNQKARLHIHTNQPAEVFSIARKSGDLLQQKAEDMYRQFKVTHSEHPPIALVTDSACDLPEEFIEAHNIHIVPVRVSFGPSTYIDKITITPEYFYQMLQTEPVHPQTSQPPPADFRNLYNFLLTHYESIISIHLPEINSGTYQNALNAANNFPDRKISVIDGLSLSVGQGFTVRKAAELIAAGKSHEEVVVAVEQFKKQTQVFVSISNLKYLMRSGRVSKAKGIAAKILHIKPILNLDEYGKPQHCGKAFSKTGVTKKLIKQLQAFCKTKKGLQFAIAHAAAPETAQYYARRLQELFNLKKVEILPAAPVLGAHAGIGAAAIAISWSE